MGLDASPESDCTVVHFGPYNRSGEDLAQYFSGLEIAQNLLPPNRYNDTLSCKDGAMNASVLVSRESRKVLVSGRIGMGIIHESFGPGMVPQTKVTVRPSNPAEAQFLNVSMVTQAGESFLVEISPEGNALLPNPLPGKYLFAVLGDKGIYCSGILSIDNPKLVVVIRSDDRTSGFCRATNNE